MDRRDILKRILYPKCKTAIEFQFDTMIVNPLLSYITVQDISQLYKIATSLKYSSKPKEKYAMINQILEPRGFKKMASGTNRVVYRYLNDYRIVLKVAIDRVGLSDNGNEYRIQHLLKPFVTKCFEVSPCGTVGLFERVVPITSREEFVNISDDIFDLINNLIGKYVLEDIGEKFYMNYGLREGFGPVLLDYPYVFELDGRKLICNVQDPITGEFCRGEIDYDVGFNNLICTRCGKRYLATDLKSEDNSDKPKIIIKGEDFMKCVLKRGNEVVSELNSKKTFGTNTIKPRKEFNNLKCKISKSMNEEKKETYKTSIVTYDDVNLKVRLRGTPSDKNKAVDVDAQRKEKITEKNTKKVSVSFDDSNVWESNKDELKVQIKTEQPEVEEIKPEKVIDDELYRFIDNSIRVEIHDTEIWNVDKNILIGYTLEHVAKLEDQYKCDSKDESDYKETTAISKKEYEKIESNRIFEKISTENKGGYNTNKIKAPIANYFSAAPVKESNTSSDSDETNINEETEQVESEIPELTIHARNDEDYDDAYDPEYDEQESETSDNEDLDLY